ncbi:hypothetical protein NQ028_08915, partial [Corynebacterium phoceense]|uniref:hypothetical protein n=1 Tax=Corynebacterium phoceense TaxID=1686286 RepID=UPI00211C4443
YFPPRCGLPRDGPHGPLHPGQIFSACSRFSHLLKRNKTWDTSVVYRKKFGTLMTPNQIEKDIQELESYSHSDEKK